MKSNKTILACSLLPALLSALSFSANAQAQMYKWVGPDGKVTYSDQPPPSGKIKVEKKSYSDSPDLGNLPPELAAVVAKNPVTLYSTNNCAPCNDSRNFLKTNGVPFNEKTISNNADLDKLKQVSGDSQLPFMIIANVKFHGFNTEDWKKALSNAGYPATSKLPKDYRYPAAEPAAPVVATAAKDAAAPPKPATPLPPQKPTQDNGIRF
ncbi:glutaredoxin family protein [Undibacterium sp. CY18W]|uniref:Glutaredoxin family protein n=1 Tax=Undibacterium hunanense TaxID=2762292 RepID=A0ABR6ZSA2_9BURK|nr:glutaredoxin family protein [Undibacterium hunanense]MBC3918755.1 glutaredoxin family protein [Undibacterium hunanense]